MSIKEQETHLILYEHNDDDDDDSYVFKDVFLVHLKILQALCWKKEPKYLKPHSRSVSSRI